MSLKSTHSQVWNAVTTLYSWTFKVHIYFCFFISTCTNKTKILINRSYNGYVHKNGLCKLTYLFTLEILEIFISKNFHFPLKIFVSLKIFKEYLNYWRFFVFIFGQFSDTKESSYSSLVHFQSSLQHREMLLHLKSISYECW